MKTALPIIVALALTFPACEEKGSATRPVQAADSANRVETPAVAAAPNVPANPSAAPEAAPVGPAAAPELRIDGNHFVDAAGKPLVLRGANHSGTEYACVQGWGLFSGPGDESVFAGMQKWKMNVVRVPLNEHCWLGINGVDAAHGGKTYQDFIQNWVKLAHAHGLAVILDLHWGAPGTHKALEQQAMANADHSVDFWKSVATTFAADKSVMYDLWNEPYLNHSKLSTDTWSCWLSGCTITGGDQGLTGPWKAAGMQTLIDAIRSTGSKQPVMVGGVEWANDLSGFLGHLPKDPANQMAASFHQYQGNLCGDSSCWTSTIANIAAKIPLVTGELGEDDCGHSFTDRYMDWADTVGVSYVMWTWNAWGDPKPTACGSQKFPLIADWNGTPTPYGEGYKARLSR